MPGARTLRADLDDQAIHDFARRQVKNKLLAIDMTQETLATAIGRPSHWISRYLRGEFNADFPTLFRIATTFHISLDALLQLPTADDPLFREWVEMYALLEPEGKDVFLKLLRRVTRGLRPRHALKRDAPDRSPQ
jgi:transcriptional regulator with XRE-family HTH domain